MAASRSPPQCCPGFWARFHLAHLPETGDFFQFEPADSGRRGRDPSDSDARRRVPTGPRGRPILAFDQMPPLYCPRYPTQNPGQYCPSPRWAFIEFDRCLGERGALVRVRLRPRLRREADLRQPPADQGRPQQGQAPAEDRMAARRGGARRHRLRPDRRVGGPAHIQQPQRRHRQRRPHPLGPLWVGHPGPLPLPAAPLHHLERLLDPAPPAVPRRVGRLRRQVGQDQPRALVPGVPPHQRRAIQPRRRPLVGPAADLAADPRPRGEPPQAAPAVPARRAEAAAGLGAHQRVPAQAGDRPEQPGRLQAAVGEDQDLPLRAEPVAQGRQEPDPVRVPGPRLVAAEDGPGDRHAAAAVDDADGQDRQAVAQGRGVDGQGEPSVTQASRGAKQAAGSKARRHRPSWRRRGDRTRGAAGGRSAGGRRSGRPGPGRRGRGRRPAPGPCRSSTRPAAGPGGGAARGSGSRRARPTDTVARGGAWVLRRMGDMLW